VEEDGEKRGDVKRMLHGRVNTRSLEFWNA